MKKSKIAFCLLIASLLLPLNLVFGAWVETDREGFWGNAYDYYWETPDNSTWNSASLDFSYGTIINFTEWKATIYQICEGWGSSWVDDDYEVESVFTLVDNSSSHIVKMTFWARNEKFGWIESDYCSFVLYVDDEVVISHWGEYEHDRFYFDLYQSQSNSSEMIANIRVYDGEYEILNGYDSTIGLSASWFNNVTLTQNHRAWGKGWCLGTKESEVIKSNDTPDGTSTGIPTIQESFWTRLWNSITSWGSALPEPIKAWFIQIQAWMSTFFTLITMIWGLVVAFLPSLGFFYFLSFIGVFMGGVMVGDIDLIQTYVMKQYELANNFANTIVSTIQAIWSLIKFW